MSMLGAHFTTPALPPLALYVLNANVLEMSLLNTAGTPLCCCSVSRPGCSRARYEHARILLGANVTRVLSVGTGRATD
jgi:hypothetical protein